MQTTPRQINIMLPPGSCLSTPPYMIQSLTSTVMPDGGYMIQIMLQIPIENATGSITENYLAERIEEPDHEEQRRDTKLSNQGVV